MCKFRILFVVALAISATGCSSDSGTSLVPIPIVTTPPPAAPPPPPPPATPPPPPVDVAGAWYSRTVNNAVNCGLGEIIDAQTIEITQTDSDIALLTSTGVSLSGTVNGDIVTWSGDVDERGGTSTLDVTIIASGTTASGDVTWTWTDGVDSCNGTATITADQSWAVAELPVSNSVPGTAQAITFTDGVAFLTGVNNSQNDSTDHFSFTVDGDSTVQVELSHFGIPASDLDLSIIDETGNQTFATSASTDSFEIVDVVLQTGTVYYVRVFATSTPADENYTISIDLN